MLSRNDLGLEVKMNWMKEKKWCLSHRELQDKFKILIDAVLNFSYLTVLQSKLIDVFSTSNIRKQKSIVDLSHPAYHELDIEFIILFFQDFRRSRRCSDWRDFTVFENIRNVVAHR